MTIVKVKIGPITAETNGETWSATDKITERILNTMAGPDQVDAGHLYVPDTALAMVDLARGVHQDLEIISVEEDEQPEDVVF